MESHVSVWSNIGWHSELGNWKNGICHMAPTNALNPLGLGTTGDVAAFAAAAAGYNWWLVERVVVRSELGKVYHAT